MKKALLLSLSFALSAPLDAATSVDRIDTETSTELRYSWPDEGLTFQLNKQDAQHFRGVKRYSPQLAARHVRHQVLRNAAQIQQQGIQVKLSPANLPLSYQLNGPDPKKVEAAALQLQQIEQTAYRNYLHQGYFYLLKLPNNPPVVIPDHLRFLQLSLNDLKPVAAAFGTRYGQQNIREVASKLALWIQKIPYQDLSNRQASAGSGYSPPLQLLLEHRGDCDSKAVLFAGVMKLMFPRTQIRMVYFRDHAVIAMQIPTQKNEQFLEIDGEKLLLIDATGPAELPLGQLSESYQRAIQNRQFTHRLL